MSKLVSYLFLTVIGLFLAAFLIANRQSVIVNFDPFSTDTPALAVGPMPLWVALVITLFIGFVLGAFGMFLNQSGARRRARERKREIRRLEKELADRPTINPAAGTSLPALRG